MSSITAQQTKLDMELVPKEKRLDIGKYNGRRNPIKIQREPTFQVVLDALAFTSCYSAFLITANIQNRQKEEIQTQFGSLQRHHQSRSCPKYRGKTLNAHPSTPGRDFFAALIETLTNKAYKKERKCNYPRYTKVYHSTTSLTQDKILSWRNKIRMHTSKDDYLINTLRFVSAKEETQIYSAILPESLTSPEMKETKAYKTYLVSTEEPTRKSKRVKRPAKKFTKAPARGVVIRETPEMPLSKKKEKVDVTRGKGIELRSQVALTKDAQFEEVQKKNTRDCHKTHLSRSGTVTKTASSAAKIKPSMTNDSNNEQESSGEDNDQKNDSDDDKTQSDNENEFDYEHETDENEPGSESDQEEDDEEEVKDELIKTTSNDSDEDETKITDKAEGDEDEEMDYTTTSYYLHSYVPCPSVISNSNSSLYSSTVIPQSLQSFTSAPQQSTSTPPPTTEATNPLSTLPDFASISNQQQITALEKEVAELKKDTFHTQVTALVDDHLDTRLGATIEEFMNFLSASLTARITEQVKNQLPRILPEEKRKTSKDAEPTKDPKAKESQSGSSKGTKSQSKSFGKSIQSEEPEFVVADSYIPQDQEENLGNDDVEPTMKALQSRHDVYSMKHILAVTHVKVIRKHGYGYLKEIVVRRVENDLYRFKEGDFPRLRINDIEDMLLLVVQNRLTNISGDDVSDFAITLRMFTRSLVILKQFEDLQLRVKSYQKKINVTKPQTTISGIRKRDPYTSYHDP
ncbi:hypothetical protein Tco_1385404 [Tanacetum coccineum]